MKIQKNTLILFALLACGSQLFAQDPVLTPPKPDFSFGANFILSNPMSDFGDSNVFNVDAGFASFGAGVGAFAHFEYKTGFFIEINTEYTRRKSTALDGAATVLTELFNEGNNSEELDFSVVENPSYRHLTLAFGPGFNYKTDDIDLYIRGKFGLTFTRLTGSSLIDSNGRTYSFQASGDVVASAGLAGGAIFFDVLKLEFSVANLGTPNFQLVFNEPSSQFSLPIQVFEAGIGYIIVK